MGEQFAIADVELFVADQQPDDLAIRDVDDRLTGFGVAVSGLGVWQRPQLMDTVEIGARHAVRIALVEVPTHADVPVREREHRFGLREHVDVERTFTQRPRLRRELGWRRHADSSNSARSWTTVSAPCWRSASAWPTRSTP